MNLSEECDKLQHELVNQNKVNNGASRLKSKQRSTSLQDVNQKEMKLLARINKRLSDLKSKATDNDNEDELSQEEEN